MHPANYRKSDSPPQNSMELSHPNVVCRIFPADSEPRGVVLMGPGPRAWKVAPALAVGCTIVMKPSEITPLTALVRRLATTAGAFLIHPI